MTAATSESPHSAIVPFTDTPLGRVIVLCFGTASFIWGALVNMYIVGHAACGDCSQAIDYGNHLAHWLTLTSIVVVVVGVAITRCDSFRCVVRRTLDSSPCAGCAGGRIYRRNLQCSGACR